MGVHLNCGGGDQQQEEADGKNNNIRYRTEGPHKQCSGHVLPWPCNGRNDGAENGKRKWPFTPGSHIMRKLNTARIL